MHDFSNHGTLGDKQVDDLLDAIELNYRPDLAAARDLAVCQRRVRMVVRAANVVDRTVGEVAAETVAMTTRYVTCHAVLPVAVGSVFHLSFERVEFDVRPTLAVCDRCAMLRDDAYEARFRFVQEIALPS